MLKVINGHYDVYMYTLLEYMRYCIILMKHPLV